MSATALIHFPAEATSESVKSFMDSLAEIAAGHGMTVVTGPKPGRGNIRELLQAIVAGEMALVLLSEDYRPDSDELKDLRRIRDQVHPYTTELLDAVIAAIEAAIARRMDSG
jgi:hypothetical protein